MTVTVPAPTAAAVTTATRTSPSGAPAGAPRSAQGPPAYAALARRPALLHLAALLAFVVTALLSRATVLDGATLSLLWPAGGVAAVWVFLSPGRHLWVALGLLGAAAGLTHALTGASVGMTLVFAASNVLQAGTFLVVVRRALPSLWPARGSQSLAGVTQLAWVSLAAVAATLVGSTTGYLAGNAVDVPLPLGTWPLWWSRNFAGLLSVFAVVHLVAFRLLNGGRTRRVPTWEWAAVVVLTPAVYVPVFWQDTYSIAFLALSTTVVVGLRSDAVVAVLHALIGGAVAVVATMRQHGPFTIDPDADHQALLVQVFLTCALLSGMFLSAAREERATASEALVAEREQSTQQAELLGSAFENVSDALVIVGPDGEFLTSNPPARRFLEMIATARREPEGGTALRRLDGTPISRSQVPTARALRGETVLHEDVRVVDADGGVHTFNVNAIPLASSGRARVVTTFRDVTDERAQVDELSTFAGVVAHDLRGPLTALRGWADLADQVVASQEDPPDDLALAVERIRSSSTRLADLLEALLVHATSRDRELSREPVDLGALAHDVAAARGIEDRVEVGRVPTVLGDAVMLHHLVDNLVGNAVKYVADGVVPRVRVEGRTIGRLVEVTFSDNGIGVPEDMRRAVFQRFQRVAGTGRKGTGLGLSICQTIVERHGGEITVGPGPGGLGSTFTVRLPAA